MRACEDDVAYLCIESFLNISVNYFEIFLAALITDPERHDIFVAVEYGWRTDMMKNMVLSKASWSFGLVFDSFDSYQMMIEIRSIHSFGFVIFVRLTLSSVARSEREDDD